MPIVESGLQPNHSEWLRLVATLDSEKKAQKVYAEFVRHLDNLFGRGDKFTCASFISWFNTRKEFREWKKSSWDPVADDRCKLSVEKRDGDIRVAGNYGLILDDWSRDETGVAQVGAVIALRVYTAGYGMCHVEQWLTAHGATVDTYVEGQEYDYQFVGDAVAQVEAQARKKRPGRIRTNDGDDGSVRPGGDAKTPGSGSSIRETR